MFFNPYKMFIILICFLNIKTAHSSQFLKNSELLKNNNTKVFVGEIRGTKLAIDQSFINLDVNKFFQVNQRGLTNSKYVGVTGTRGCGRDDNALAFNIQEKAAPLLIYKPDKDLKFSWMSAKKIEKNKCYKPKTTEKKTSLYVVSNLTHNFLLVYDVFSRKLTQSEIQKDCGTTDSGCVEHSKENNRDFLKLTYIEADKCSSNTIVEKVLDMDGKNSVETAMSDFFGVLKIGSEKNNSEENWLIFNAPGYEGHGILGVEKKQFLKKIISDEDWTVYNGC